MKAAAAAAAAAPSPPSDGRQESDEIAFAASSPLLNSFVRSSAPLMEGTTRGRNSRKKTLPKGETKPFGWAARFLANGAHYAKVQRHAAPRRRIRPFPVFVATRRFTNQFDSELVPLSVHIESKCVFHKREHSLHISNVYIRLKYSFFGMEKSQASSSGNRGGIQSWPSKISKI